MKNQSFKLFITFFLIGFHKLTYCTRKCTYTHLLHIFKLFVYLYAENNHTFPDSASRYCIWAHPLDCDQPVGMTDGTLPLVCIKAHPTLAADAVAAAPAHGAAVPELSKGPLAARTRPFAILAGETLGSSPTELLELLLQSPDETGNTRNIP